MEGASYWADLQAAASQPDGGRSGLWAWLKEKLDLTLYRPRAADGIVASELQGREGTYYVLKNPATKTYYRLGERDHFLWQRFDGQQAVKDLVVAYFLEYGTFAFGRVSELVAGLRASAMLDERPVDIYEGVRARLETRRPGYRLNRVWQAFLGKQFAISGLDRFGGGVYRWGGWLAYTWPAQILFLVIVLAGLYAFVQALRVGDYGVLMVGGSLLLGVAGLLAANLVSFFLHEMAHALTVKHYGREVRRGGFMLYFGMPAFFVDTTDIWLEPKRARLAVTWAGPYSGLILGGLASLVLLFWPGFALNPLLFQFAILSYLTVFLNLNPLLELDGYYLLMDWLEIPMLRRRSLAFLRGGLWQKLRAGGPPVAAMATEAEPPAGHAPPGRISAVWGSLRAGVASLSREEKIFAVYGVLTALWTAYAIYMGASIWQQRLVGAVRDLWAQDGGLGKMALALGTALLSLVIVLSIGLAFASMARRVLDWAVRRGLLANTWLVAAILLIVAVALAWVPRLFGYPILALPLSVVALASATYLAWRNALDFAGARLARPFWLLGFFAVALLLRQAAIAGLDWPWLSRAAGPDALRPAGVVLGHSAYLALLAAGLLLFGDTDLKALRPGEKLLLALGLLVSYGLVLGLAVARPGGDLPPGEFALRLGGTLVPVLVLTGLLPTLTSYWRTGFGPAWALLAAGLAGLGAANLLGLPPLLAYLLLAGALLLHHLAYRYVTFLPERPEASLDLSDRRRLQRAHGWTSAAVVAQFQAIAGDRAGQALAERFNIYAQAADWPLRLVRQEAEDGLPAEASLIEAGATYAAALNLLLDLVASAVGERLTVRGLQRAYDGLPWDEREIGAQYLFPEVARAGVLDRQFEADSRDYLALLRRMPLFATMDAAELGLLRSRLRPEHHAAGKVIIRQGDAGDRFYIVERGHVEVTVRDERGVTDAARQLDRGDYFGELALLRDAPRNATCRTTVPSNLLSLSREDFDALVRRRLELGEKLDRSIARAQLLRRMPLFSELDGGQIQYVAAQLRAETYEPGEALIRQGEIGDTFYVIESGRVQVTVRPEGTEDGVPAGAERILTERGPGEYVGEIALLLEVPRTATVRALTRVAALALHKDDFDRLVADHLRVGRVLEQDTSRRMMGLRRVD